MAFAELVIIVDAVTFAAAACPAKAVEFADAACAELASRTHIGNNKMHIITIDLDLMVRDHPH